MYRFYSPRVRSIDRRACKISTPFLALVSIEIAIRCPALMPSPEIACKVAYSSFRGQLRTLTHCKSKTSIECKKAPFVIGVDLWEGDATKHFSVKEKGFSVKRGEAFSE